MVLKKDDLMMLNGIVWHRLESVADSYKYGSEASVAQNTGNFLEVLFSRRALLHIINLCLVN